MGQEKRKYIGDICYIRLSSEAELVCIADESLRVPLTPTEYKILSYFIEQKNTPVYLEELARHMWGGNYMANQMEPRSLAPHISRIRRKMKQLHIDTANLFETNHGFGSYTLYIRSSLPKQTPEITAANDHNTDHINRLLDLLMTAADTEEIRRCQLLMERAVKGYIDDMEISYSRSTAIDVDGAIWAQQASIHERLLRLRFLEYREMLKTLIQDADIIEIKERVLDYFYHWQIYLELLDARIYLEESGKIHNDAKQSRTEYRFAFTEASIAKNLIHKKVNEYHCKCNR